MAQTIAMVRGSGSLASGSADATLYTQSGGNATRVIFNGLSMKTSSGGTQWYTTICLISAGGSSSVLGWGRWYAGAAQFVPMAMQANTAYSPGGNSSATASLPTAWANQNNITYTGDSQPDQISSGYPGLALGGGMPLNFWMGSGDSIRLRNYNSSYSTNFGYSFTTITES